MTEVPNVDNMSTLDAAMAYAKAGLYIVPVVNRTKHPGSVLGKGWHEQSSNDPGQIHAWFGGDEDYGIALHAGKSGLVVFDVDYPEELPDILTEAISRAPYQTTRRSESIRGHYLFDNGGVNYSNSNGSLPEAWGEVRGMNGVVIVAPTDHEEFDGLYQWRRTGAVPGLPEELGSLLTEAKGSRPSLSRAAVDSFIEGNTDDNRPSLLNHVLHALAEKYETGAHGTKAGSRHNATRNALAWAFTEAYAGCYPAGRASESVREMFEGIIGGERDTDSEFESLEAWAMAQASASDPVATRERLGMLGYESPLNGLHHKAVSSAEQSGAYAVVREQREAALDRKVYSRTHQGCAERLLVRYRDLIAWCPDTGWRVWDGRVWQEDTAHIVQGLVLTLRDIIGGELEAMEKMGIGGDELDKHKKLHWDCQNQYFQQSVMKLLEKFVIKSYAEFDQDPHKLTVANGTLVFDVETGDVTRKDHDPSDYITRMSPANYDPNATAPFFASTLNLIMPDETLRTFAQTLAGYTLLGGQGQGLFVMCYGEGGTGKSTLTDAIGMILGEQYGGMTDPATLRKPGGDGSNATPNKAKLRSLRFVTCDESTDRIDMEQMKSWTGGGKIAARELHKGIVEFYPDFTLWLNFNSYPELSSTDYAVERRIALLPFKHQIPEASKIDKNLVKVKMDRERDGILTWAIEGFKRYAKDGRVIIPEEAQVKTKEMLDSIDWCAQFVEENYEEDPTGFVGTTEVWGDFRRYGIGDPELSKVAKNKLVESLTKRWKSAPSKPQRGGFPRRNGWIGWRRIEKHL